MINKFKIWDKATIIGWISRLGVLILSFANTRFLIEALGIDGMASYTIIMSITPWIGLLNLGLPITMQNEVSRLRSQGADIDTFQQHAIGTMLLIGLFLLPMPLTIGWAIHSLLLVDYEQLSLSIIIIAVLLMYISAIFQLLPQLMYANNNAIWPNLYPLISAIWMFMVLAITVIFELTNIGLIMITVMMSNILMPIHASLRSKSLKNFKIDLRVSFRQILVSKNILLFTTIATSVLSVDYIIMSRTLNSTEIVKYGVTSKLFLIILTFHGVLIAVNWTPVSDSINSKSMKEARAKIAGILKFGMSIGLTCGILIIIFQDFIFKTLTGGEVVNTSNFLIVSFLFYTLLRIWTDTFTFALQGCGRVNLINKFLPIQAVISCGGQYYLGGAFGAVGILWGMILSFLLTSAWIVPYHFSKITGEQ